MKYKVVLHWDVAYIDEVEAESEEQAIELAENKAMNAPSEDWTWLEQTMSNADQMDDLI